MFQIFKIVKVMVGSGRDVQWCVLNCYLWLPETESFPFSGWTALRVAFFVQYLSRVCSLTIIFCCWYTTETAGSSYVYCGMADKIAMILTMWVLYSYLLEKTDFKKLKWWVFFISILSANFFRRNPKMLSQEEYLRNFHLFTLYEEVVYTDSTKIN